MHIGILGSYFNPPHLGHLLVAQQVLDFTDIDRLWFLPGFKSTFNKQLISSEHRLAMTRLIRMPRTEVSTIELDQQLDGNTINLVPILSQKYPKDTFTFIIGSDQLSAFHKWGSWQELLKQLPFLVVDRASYPMVPLHVGMKPLTHPLFVTTNISSSVVRERIKKGLSIEPFVIPAVEEYIGKHGLYR